MNSASCSMVGLRNTGAVSRMKSFQNWPGASSTSGGGAEAHQPLLEALGGQRAGERLLDDEDHAVAALAQELPMPTQLLVGPNAPSGKKTTVALIHRGQLSHRPVASSQSEE